MKNLLLLFAVLLSVTVAAQDYPGARPELLIGKEVKVVPLNEGSLKYHGGGYPKFYTDENLYKIYKKNNNMRTAADAFGDHTLKVLAVEPYVSYGKKRYKIKLEDTTTKELVYNDYDPASRTEYFLTVVGGLNLPADFYCDKVKEGTNDNGEQELTAGEMFSYYLTRTKKKGNKLVYDLIFETQVDNEETGDGMTIFLMNGDTIERPKAKVIKEKKGATPHYFATIELTPAELQLLSRNRVKGFRLYKHNGFFPASFAENLQGALNCMMSKK